MGSMLAGCAPEAAPTASNDPEVSADPVAEIATAACEEGELMVYSVLVEGVLTALLDEFRAEYPCIKTDYVRQAGTALFNRFETEMEAGSLVADSLVPTAQPSFITGHPDWFVEITDDLVPASKDWPADSKEKYLLRTLMEIWGIIYNTETTTRPETWADILDPKLKGRIVLVDPNASPVYHSWYSLARENLGDDFLRQLGQQDPVWVDTAAVGAQQVATGAKDVVAPSAAAHAGPLIAEGASLDYNLDTDMTQTVTVMIAIPKVAPHPNAARLWANFLLSTTALDIICEAGGYASPVSGTTNCGAPPAHPFAPIWDVPTEKVKEIETLLGR
jgi:iron(III) transport system substrate-binding protein